MHPLRPTAAAALIALSCGPCLRAADAPPQPAAPKPAETKPAAPAIAESDFCRSLRYQGVALQEKGWHIWGCSPITDAQGKVHLFVERWPVKGPDCPRDFDAAWRHDSQIAHYVGDKPEGPFTLRDVALQGTGTDTWDRFAPGNPCIQRVDGRYVLLYIANPVGMTRGMGAHPGTQRIGMAVADSLDGPWRKVGKDGLILSPSEDPKHWTHGSQVVNPAFLKRPDGKCLIYYKANDRGRGPKMGVAVADKLEGPYAHQPAPFTTNDRAIEDGYAFMTGGRFWFLTTDNHGIFMRGGGLLWQSADGLAFDPVPQGGFKPSRFYLPKAEPGQARSYYAAGTLQRPQLLVENGRPAYLYAASGSVVTGADGTVCYLFKCGADAPPPAAARP